MDLENLTDKEVETMGTRLKVLVKSLPYQDMLDIMQSVLSQADNQVLNYKGSDAALLLTMQQRRKGMAEFYVATLQAIDGIIGASDALKQPVGLTEGDQI